jgi:hypothetical protein
MINYTFKIAKFALDSTPGDTTITITGFLMDTNGYPFTSNSRLDTFLVQTIKSQLPLSNYAAYFAGLAAAAINLKYTFSVTGTATNGNSSLTGISSTSGILSGMSVTGPGVPASSVVIGVPSSTQINISNNMVTQVTGTLTAPEIVKTGDITTNSDTISNLSSTADLTVGMLITGANIPSGTTIKQIVDGTTILTTIMSMATASGQSLTFSPNTNSYLVTSVSPTIMASTHVGLTITGTGIPDDTTISEITSSSSFKISKAATQGGSQTLSISGSYPFVFSTANWSIDYSELNTLVSQINFGSIQ